MDGVFYHGTNQTFTSFAPELRGMNNANTASESGFFFSKDPRTAWDYANQAARRLVPGQVEHQERIDQLIAAADRALAAGKYDEAERITMQYEDMETEALRAEPAGQRVYVCSLSFTNPLHIDGSDRAVLSDLAGCINRARAAGHDALIVEHIRDTPSGLQHDDTHLVVFDPEQISIVAVLMDPSQQADAVMTDEPDLICPM